LYESPLEAPGAFEADSSFLRNRKKSQEIGARIIRTADPRIPNLIHFLYSHFATKLAAFFAFLFQLCQSGLRTNCIHATSVFFREPKLLVKLESGSSSKYLYVLIG